jgi:hypothetical protein
MIFSGIYDDVLEVNQMVAGTPTTWSRALDLPNRLFETMADLCPLTMDMNCMKRMTIHIDDRCAGI